MTSADPFEGQGRNRLLSSLPREYLDRLLPRLEFLDLPFKFILYEANVPIPYVYFIATGVASLVTVMDDGMIAEVATVGNQGMVGVPLLLGARSITGRAFMQVPGTGFRLPAESFVSELRHDGPLRDLLGRYTQGLFTQISQSAACNRLHSIDERCARWLLMTHDRVAADRFPLTQEFLSQMLGVRRASVSTAAGILQRAGFITYSRGIITVIDRPGLESASCECYRIIRTEYERLLGE